MNKTEQSRQPQSPVSPQRRAFFHRLAPKAESIIPVSIYPRPPWSLENNAFLALCTQCGECIDQCPMRVLGPSDESDEMLKGRPVLDLSHGYCDFCGQCAEVCQTGAIDRNKGLRRQAMPMLTGRCQVELGLYCNLCEEGCPESAITFTQNNKLTIDTERCSGCGKCALDCYSRVLVMKKDENS